MSARKNRGENLLDDFILSNDYFMQFLLHHLAVLAEFLKHITEATLFSGHTVLLIVFNFVVVFRSAKQRYFTQRITFLLARRTHALPGSDPSASLVGRKVNTDNVEL